MSGQQGALAVGEIELTVGARSVRCPETIVQLLVLVLNGDIAHEVEVDVLWDIQYVLLDLVGRVIDDIEVSRKTEALRVDGHKAQVYTLIAVHKDRVHDIVLVVTHRHETVHRRYESVEEQGDRVRINIHIGEDRGKCLVQCLCGDK